MFATRLFPAFLFLGIAAFAGTAGAQSPGAGQTAAEPTAKPVAARAPYSPFKDIHVDQDCHILPDPAHRDATRKRPRLRKDPVICHLESVLSSNHMEETIAGNEVRRSYVSIAEQEYVLQNVTTGPAIFVVEESVPQGWVVDSDPQPAEMNGATAVFRVQAQPGEIVRLHVGLRHAKPLRVKIIKTSPLAPAGSAGN
jgi:hypothetical protein